jgi:TP901 family phage tail tape measure protein
MASTTFDIGIVIRVINRATSGIRNATREFTNMQKVYKRANKEFERAANIRQAAEGISRVARAMRNVFVNPIQISEQFGAAMSKVQALSGATGSSLDKLRQQAEFLGETTKFTAIEAADAMGFMAMAGFDTEKIMATLPTTLNLSTAAGVDLARTSDILTDIMGAFGKDASEATGVADTLTRAFTGSNTTLETLFETMKMAGPIATDFGVSLEHVSAMAGVLGSAGLKGTLGGTAMRAFFTRLVAARGPGKKAMGLLGLDPRDAEGNLRPPLELLREIAAKTKDMGSVKRGAILTALFGREALAGVSNLMRSIATGGMDDMLDKMSDTGKTAKSVASIMQDNARGSTILLTSAIEGLQKALGDALAPALAIVKNSLRSAITWVTESIKKYPTLSKWVISVTAGLAIFATVLAGVTFALGALITAKATFILGAGALVSVIAAIKAALFGLSAVMAGISFLLGPTFLPAIAAATAVVISFAAAIKLLSDNWEELMNLDFGEVFRGFQETVGERGLRDTANLIVADTIKSGAGLIDDAGEFVSDVFGGGGGPEAARGGSAEQLAVVKAIESGARTRGVSETRRMNEVGGVITVKVEGPGRVTSVESNGPVDLETDTGAMGDE